MLVEKFYSWNDNMMISDFNLAELDLTPRNGKPNADKPEPGDVWISKDDRVIVVTKVDEPLIGNNRFVRVLMNGEVIAPNIKSWKMFLLSLQAFPVGRLEI